MRLKKVILATLVTLLGLSLVACGGKNDNPSNDNDEINIGGNGGGEGPKVDESNVVSENPGTVVTSGEVNVIKSAGKNEGGTITFNKINSAQSYNIYVDGNKVDEKNAYTQIFEGYARTDLFGLTKGSHTVEIAAVKNGTESNAVKTKVSFEVSEYDRSGYAHFKYSDGVGAYKDNGTLKDNAIVLYVTDENKNSVTLSYNGKTVTGIGNILNSVGQECGEAGHEGQCKKVSDGKSYYAKANTNQGILLDLAQNNIPLVVRFVGCVSNSGLYQPGTFDAKKSGLIDGLTAYAKSGETVNEDGTMASKNANLADYGGTAGDNGHMARMKSGKNITFEGVGSEATIDGWGFHLICETAYSQLAKNFEVRNLAFINTPEDAIGMEGQETESTLTITAAVERCWIHHNTFISPVISNPAEGDKSEGDGSCDFKRGRYFTCSYNYFEDCHKTNLVGSSKTSVQYNLSYHHNIWNNCASRQPLARQANIHFYNNLIIGTTDTVSSLRANSYMFAEGNYYMGCSRVVEYKNENGTGTCKSFNNVLIGCYNNYDATVVQTREEEVESSKCKDNATNTSYANFDTNSELFYYDSTNKRSDCYLTSAAQARIDCIKTSGSAYRIEAGKCKLGIDSIDITTVASSETINGSKSLTIAKAKGIIKVFTVTSPVTITIAATSNSGFDTGYLLKMDGTLVLALSATDKTAVLENGTYVITSSVAFTGSNGKNDKETTVTKCIFESYDSEELNAQLITNYNNAVAAIPSTIIYNDSCYQAIKNAMDIYNTLGDLKSEVTNYSTVTNAFDQYKNAGKNSVESIISTIGSVNSESGSTIASARLSYNTLIARCPDVTISNYQTLLDAENAYSSFAIDACINAINNIGTVTLDSNDAIEEAEALYIALDDDQKSQVTNYNTLLNAKLTYNSLLKVKTVNDAIISANDLLSYEEALEGYNALTDDEKGQINVTNLDVMKKDYTIALINSLPETVTRSNKDTVIKIRALYDALSNENKALVTNYDKLTAAEETLAALPSTEVTKTLTASDFNITGVSTTAFNGLVWSNGSIIGVSKVKYDSVSTVVLNATIKDSSVSFMVSYSIDGNTWTDLENQKPSSNNSAKDLTYTINATGEVFIKISIVGTKANESNAKQGTINSINVTCYE